MNYRQLGSTGARVSELTYGTDNLGNRYGADEETSRRLLDTVLDAGINHIDTADSYAENRSEEIIGRYLADTGRRGEVFLTTKVRSRVGDGPNDVGASRYHVMAGIEASLRRLQTDHVDLYLIHSFDPTTPVEETVRALDDVVRAGKARYVGCSNWPAWRLMQALWISDVSGLARFDCIQSVFNILQPSLALDVIPMCRERGVAVTTYSPMASGLLTGKHPRSGPLADSKFGARDETRGGALGRRYWDERRLDAVDRLREISEQSGEPMMRLVLQWVRETPGVTAPIIGARSEEQLASTLDAWNGSAPDDVMAEVRRLAEELDASLPVAYPPVPSAP